MFWESTSESQTSWICDQGCWLCAVLTKYYCIHQYSNHQKIAMLHINWYRSQVELRWVYETKQFHKMNLRYMQDNTPLWSRKPTQIPNFWHYFSVQASTEDFCVFQLQAAIISCASLSKFWPFCTSFHMALAAEVTSPLHFQLAPLFSS